MSGVVTQRPKWPTEQTPYGPVEYKRIKGSEHFCAMPNGLLLGKVWKDDGWYAEGWTPETDGWEFGPFERRWHAFEALRGVEVRGLDLRGWYSEQNLAKRQVTA